MRFLIKHYLRSGQYGKKCLWCCGLLVLAGIYAMHENYGILDVDKSRCDINVEKRDNIRYLTNVVTKVLEKYNVTYWLDFGTALGAYRYCDVIAFDYDADISYLSSDFDKLQMSLEELRGMAGITISTDIVDVHFKNARVDIRGYRKVRKWSMHAFYHQLLGEYDHAEDYFLYQIIENRADFPVFIRNQLYDKIQYSLLQKRRKVRFGNSCAYVVDDLMGLLKSRYPFSLNIEMQTKERCLGKFGLPPICHHYQC